MEDKSWYRGSDSNRHGQSPSDFESDASTSFTTPAILINCVIVVLKSLKLAKKFSKFYNLRFCNSFFKFFSNFKFHSFRCRNIHNFISTRNSSSSCCSLSNGKCTKPYKTNTFTGN